MINENENESSDNVEYTLDCIETASDSDQMVEEGEWFEADVKRLFNAQIITSLGYDIDQVLSFKLQPNDGYTRVRQRLGYFNTQIGQIIHKAVCQMKLNQLYHLSFEFDPQLLDESFKTKPVAERIFLDLKFEIRLVSVEKNFSHLPPIYKMNEHELYALCLEHKNDANELFKKHFIRTSFKRYQKSINYLIVALQLIGEKLKGSTVHKLDDIDEEQESSSNDQLSKLNVQMLETKSQLYSNLSLCQIKNNNNQMAILNCTKCLEIDTKNVKALFRRAQARANLNDYEEALDDLKKALCLDPNNQEIKNKIVACEKSIKTHEQLMALKFKKLFT